MLPIELNSKILIDFFKQIRIDFNSICYEDKLIISNNKVPVSEKEMSYFETDLMFLLSQMQNIDILKLHNIPLRECFWKEMIKQTYASEISFDGSETFFDRIKTNYLDLSNVTRYSLDCNKEQKVSEFEYFQSLKIGKQHHITPVIDINDLEIALKYINISDIKVKIRDEKDFEQLKLLVPNRESKIFIDIFDLENIPALKNNKNYTINLDIRTMAELSIKELETLEQFYKLDKVSINQEPNSIEPSTIEILSDIREIYEIKTYKKLRQEIDSLLKGIEKTHHSKEDNFVELYKRLSNKITYDKEQAKLEAENEKYHYPPAHNLIGGLFYNRCVCEAYAKILKQAAACIGIESKFIIGSAGKKDEKHAWNQVKLHNYWYNVDLTWDSPNIRNGNCPKYFLLSDEEFENHTTDSILVEPCLKSFDRKKINEFFKNTYFCIQPENELFQSTSCSISNESRPGKWNLFFNSLKNKFRKTQKVPLPENIQNESNPPTSQNKTKQLPSWDLKNWTSLDNPTFTNNICEIKKANPISKKEPFQK